MALDADWVESLHSNANLGSWKVYQHSELQDAGRFTNTLSFRMLEGLPTLAELQDAGRFTNTMSFRTLEGLPTL